MRFLAVIFLIICSAHESFGNLQVFPTRVYISAKERSGQLSLRNRSDKPTKYKISTVFYNMLPDGNLKPGAVTDEKSAANLIRFSPRSVELKPNEEQVVRILLKPSEKKEEGDYRIHLLFEEVDPPQEESEEKAKETSMQLKAKLAIAIPVVVRFGNPQVTVKLENPVLKSVPGNRIAFSTDLTMTGTGYAFGDFHIFFTPEGGSEAKVGEVTGVSSYIPKRQVHYSINTEKEFKITKGIVRIEMRTPSGDNDALIAEVSGPVKP